MVGDNAAFALGAVREAADELGLPVMVHVSDAPPPLGEILAHLRAGDIVTHCFTPYENGVVASDGSVKREVLDALERGVLLDVGHGGGSFSFPAAEAYAASGKAMPITSTDLHSKSVLGPAFDMATVLSKMLAAGFSLEDVLRSATTAPAQVLGVEPAIREGAAADVAVLALERGSFRFWDSRGEERRSDVRLAGFLTVRLGEVAFASPSAWLRANGGPR